MPSIIPWHGTNEPTVVSLSSQGDKETLTIPWPGSYYSPQSPASFSPKNLGDPASLPSAPEGFGKVVCSLSALHSKGAVPISWCTGSISHDAIGQGSGFSIPPHGSATTRQGSTGLSLAPVSASPSLHQSMHHGIGPSAWVVGLRLKGFLVQLIFL